MAACDLKLFTDRKKIMLMHCFANKGQRALKKLKPITDQCGAGDRIDEYEVSIAIPVEHKVRNIPLKLREGVKRELEKLREVGVIERVEVAEWVSPLVVVQKNTGEIRLCVDLRCLNKNIVVEKPTLITVDELRVAVKDARIFSTIDMSSAYHQIPLSQESRALTAFITTEGIFQFTRLPFGLASSASALQRIMNTMLAGIKNTLFYQDDLLVFGKDMEEHNLILEQVFKRFLDSGLTMQMEKCKFGRRTIEYLEHDISASGVHPKECLVKAICSAPLSPPANEQK